MTDDLIALVEDMLLSAFDSFDSMLVKSSNVLQNGVSAYLWSTVQGMSSSALVPFCNIIIGICLLIELASTASKVDIIKWEHGLKIGVKMALSKVCISVAPTFLRACYNQTSIFIGNLMSAGSGSSLGAVCSTYLSTYISSISGFGEALGLLVSTLLLQMAIKICGMLILVMAYGRVFEILIYLLVSPIPCAFFPLSGNGEFASRITMKFFKTFIAVCLQGLMMFMSVKLFGTVINTAFADGVSEILAGGASASTVIADLCYNMLLFSIVLVMAVAKSGSWAKSIIDAG